MELTEEGKYGTVGFNNETGVFEKAIISVEGITTDTEKDFSPKDMSSPIIFAQKTDYEEVVYTDEEGNEVTEQLEVQRTLKIEDEHYLYGGKNGWYYGIWKGSLSGSLYTVPFSESKLEEFKEGTENIQSEEDIERYQEQVTAVESDNGETESKVHFSLPQENTDKITECVLITYGSEVDLEKALIGNVSTDSSDDNYFCFIEGDYIHHSRTGGNAYYEIEGIKGDTEESTGSVFKMPSISKVVTDSSEYISGLKGSLSIAGVLNAEALVSKNGVSGSIQAGLGPVGIGLSRGTETHASSYGHKRMVVKL